MSTAAACLSEKNILKLWVDAIKFGEQVDMDQKKTAD